MEVNQAVAEDLEGCHVILQGILQICGLTGNYPSGKIVA